MEFGVSPGNATALAATHGLAQVKLGVRLAEQARGTIASRPGLLVTLLRDRTIERALEKRDRVRRVSSRSDEHGWRLNQMYRLRLAIGSPCGRSKWPAGAALLREVRSTWPTDEAMVLANVLTDEDLRDVEARPIEAATKLRDAARCRRSSAESMRAVCSIHSAAKMSGASS
ncbi:MAG: hypothetical protein ACF8GE_05180 [Phycisphaerales bacterium JB043]